MQRIVEEHREQIAELCRRFRVRRLELFGSAARDDFDPSRSDIDLIVVFERGTEIDAFGQYFEFKEALEGLFGRSVDLVAGVIKNPYLKASIDKSKELLFAA